jgi:hypothetical protein
MVKTRLEVTGSEGIHGMLSVKPDAIESTIALSIKKLVQHHFD